MKIRISEYRARFMVILLLAIIAFLFNIVVFVRQFSPVITASSVIATICLFALLLAYRRGGQWADAARYLTVVICTILICGVLILDQPTSKGFSAGFFVPPVLALIMIGWESILVVGVATLIALGVALPAPNPYLQLNPIILIGLVILSMAVARITLDTMREDSEKSANLALKAQQNAEKEAMLAREQADQLQRQTNEQQRLLALVTELETPVVTIAENVLLMPVIGALDKLRAENITRRLLKEVSDRRSKLVILDLAGLNTVDTATAQEIYRLINAVRLLGCRVIVTSITSPVAIALTQLGVATDIVDTARSPQEVLSNYLSPSFSKN